MPSLSFVAHSLQDSEEDTNCDNRFISSAIANIYAWFYEMVPFYQKIVTQ
jgi:hypothetical protein